MRTITGPYGNHLAVVFCVFGMLSKKAQKGGVNSYLKWEFLEGGVVILLKIGVK